MVVPVANRRASTLESTVARLAAVAPLSVQRISVFVVVVATTVTLATASDVGSKSLRPLICPPLPAVSLVKRINGSLVEFLFTYIPAFVPLTTNLKIPD